MRIYSQRNWQRLKSVLNSRLVVALVAVVMLITGGLYVSRMNSRADVNAQSGYSVSTVYQYYLLSTNKNQLVSDSSDAKLGFIHSGALGAGDVSGEFGYNDIINSAPNKKSAKEFVTEMSTYSFYHYWENQMFGFPAIKQMFGRLVIGLLFLPFALVVDSINLVVYGLIGLIAKANFLVAIGDTYHIENFNTKLATILGVDPQTFKNLANAFLSVAIIMILLALLQMLKHGSAHIDQRGAHKFGGRLFALVGVPIIVVLAGYIINDVNSMVQKSSLGSSSDLRSVMIDDKAWAYRQNFAPTGSAQGGAGDLYDPNSDILGHNGSWVQTKYNPYNTGASANRIANINNNSGTVSNSSDGAMNHAYVNSSLVIRYLSCSTFDAQDYLSYEGSEQSSQDHAVGSYYSIAHKQPNDWLVDTGKIYSSEGNVLDKKKGPDDSYTKAIKDYQSQKDTKKLGTDASGAWRDRFVWGAKTGGDMKDYYNADPSIEQVMAGLGGSAAGSLGGYQMSTASMYYILCTNFNDTGGRYSISAPARGVLQAKQTFDSNRSTYYDVSLVGLPLFSLLMVIGSMIALTVVLVAMIRVITSVGFIDMNTRPLKAWVQSMTLGDIEYLEATLVYGVGIAGTILILAAFPQLLIGSLNVISRLVFEGINLGNEAGGAQMSPTADESFWAVKTILQSIVMLIFGYAYFKDWHNIRENLDALLAYPWAWAKTRGDQLERQAGGNLAQQTKRNAKLMAQPNQATKAFRQFGANAVDNTLGRGDRWARGKVGNMLNNMRGIQMDAAGSPIGGGAGGDGTEKSIDALADRAKVTPAQQVASAVKGKHQMNAHRVNEIPGKENGHGGYVDKTYADGTETQEYDDGTAAMKSPDGTLTQINPDGSMLTEGQDGSRVMRAPDGTMTAYDPESGDTVTTNPDGLKKVEHADHSVEYLNPDDTPYQGIVVGDDGKFAPDMLQKADIPTQQQALTDLANDPDTPEAVKPDIQAAHDALQKFQDDPTSENAQAAQDALNQLHSSMADNNMDPRALQQVQNQADKLNDFSNPVRFNSALVSPDADPKKAVSDMQDALDNLKAHPTAENAQKLQNQLIAMQPALAGDPAAQAKAAQLAKALTPATEASSPEAAATALKAAKVDQLGNQLTDQANQDIDKGIIKSNGDVKADGTQTTGNPEVDKKIGNLNADNFKANNLNADGTIKGDPNALTNQLNQALASGMKSGAGDNGKVKIGQMDPTTGEPIKTHLDANGNEVTTTGKLDTTGLKIDPDTGRPVKATLDSNGQPLKTTVTTGSAQTVNPLAGSQNAGVQTGKVHLDANGEPVKTEGKFDASNLKVDPATGKPLNANLNSGQSVKLDSNGQPLKTVTTGNAQTVNPQAGAQKVTAQLSNNGQPIRTMGTNQNNGTQTGIGNLNGGTVKTSGNVQANGPVKGSGSVQTSGPTTVRTGASQTVNPQAGAQKVTAQLSNNGQPIRTMGTNQNNGTQTGIGNLNGGTVKTSGPTTVRTGASQTVNPQAGAQNAGNLNRAISQAVQNGMRNGAQPNAAAGAGRVIYEAGNQTTNQTINRINNGNNIQNGMNSAQPNAAAGAGRVIHEAGNQTTNQTINRINNGNNVHNATSHMTTNNVQRGADTAQLQDAVQNGMNSAHPAMRAAGGAGMGGNAQSMAAQMQESIKNAFDEATQQQNQSIANAISNALGNNVRQDSQLQQSIRAIGHARNAGELNAAVHHFGAKLNALSPQQKQGINFNQLNTNVRQLRDSMTNNNGEAPISKL